MKLDPRQTAIVVIDVQERLAAAMPNADRDRVTQNVARLLDAARILEMSVIVTEQYPKGLGPTVEVLGEQLGAMGVSALSKLEFDVTSNTAVGVALGELDARQVIVAGMESHICIYQSVRGLVEEGFQTYVCADATCARDPQNHRIAEGLWSRAGAVLTSTEAALFDLIGGADHPAFREISKLIK